MSSEWSLKPVWRHWHVHLQTELAGFKYGQINRGVSYSHHQYCNCSFRAVRDLVNELMSGFQKKSHDMTAQHLLYECNIVKCQRWFHWWMKKLWRIVFLKVWPLNARRPGKKTVFSHLSIILLIMQMYLYAFCYSWKGEVTEVMCVLWFKKCVRC